MKEIQSFICTVASSGLHNWEICKSIESWGIATNGMKVNLPDVNKEDILFIYRASKGLIATARVKDKITIPRSREETPWAGGMYRYGALVPFRIEREYEEAIPVKFENMRIAGTKISVTSLRRGFSRVEPADSKILLELIGKFIQQTS